MMKNRYDHACGCRPERPCPPPRPEVGNGRNIRVSLKSVNGTPMDELNFVLHFRVFGCPDELTLHKQQLYTAQGKYYALINDKIFPDGWLMCDIEIYEPMPGWANGLKPASLSVCTGLMLGNCFDTPYPMGCSMPNGKGYINGFKVKFEMVDDLPEIEDEDDDDDDDDNGGGSSDNGGGSSSSGAYKYGVVTDNISSLGELTEAMVSGLSQAEGAKEIDLNVVEGNKAVVLIPAASALVAKKDDGAGTAIPFDGYLAENGLALNIGGVDYKVYGEMLIVSGTLKLVIA